MNGNAAIRAAAALALLCAGAAQAQVEINHARAMAGSVTSGDAPGYPVVISQPGHYRLTGHLVVPAGVNGIEITHSGVTLDLNGHSVFGPVQCVPSPSMQCTGPVNDPSIGIRSVKDLTTIRNGRVRGFGEAGIDLRFSGVVEDMWVALNHGDGLRMSHDQTGAGGRVSNVQAHYNQGIGVVAYNAIVERVVTSYNDIGVKGRGMLLVDSTLNANRTSGILVHATPAQVPIAMRGTMVFNNAVPIQGDVRSLGGNLVDGVPF